MKKPAKMDAAYFIRKFKAIPASKWRTGDMGTVRGKKCAVGHCAKFTGDNWYHTDESNALMDLLETPAIINDGEDKRYRQKTPRARILAALADARKAGR